MKKTCVLLFVLVLLESCNPGPSYVPLYKFFDNNTNASIWSDDPMTIYFSKNTASNTSAFANYHDLYVENRYSFMVEANYQPLRPFIIRYQGTPIIAVQPRLCTTSTTNHCNMAPIVRAAPSRTTPTFTVQSLPTCMGTVPRFTRLVNFNSGPCTGNNAAAWNTIIATISIPYEPVAPRNGDVFEFEITGTPIGAATPETVLMRAVYVDVQCSASVSLSPPPPVGPSGTQVSVNFNATNAKQVTVRSPSGTVLYDRELPVGTSSVSSSVPFTITGGTGSRTFTITALNLMKQNCQGITSFTVPRVPDTTCSNCAGCPPACVDCPGCEMVPTPRCPNERLICYVIGDTVSGIEGGPQSRCAVDWAQVVRELPALLPAQYIRQLTPCPDWL